MENINSVLTTLRETESLRVTAPLTRAEEQILVLRRFVAAVLRDYPKVSGHLLIAEERMRQLDEHGFSLADDLVKYSRNNELGQAAASYAAPELASVLWPWDPEYLRLNPTNRVAELMKAGALIAAALDVELEKQATA